MLSNIILRRQSRTSSITKLSSHLLRTMTSTTSQEVKGPVAQIIEKKLNDAFNPTYLEVRNESYMHNV